MKEVFAPADDIADGEMYLRLAADLDSRIVELKARFKATGDRKIFYSIQDLKAIQREHRKTAFLLLSRGERRKKEKDETISSNPMELVDCPAARKDEHIQGEAAKAYTVQKMDGLAP